MTAFRASYADWKLVKTRACVQVVFEIPIEQADAAYQVLGGMPLASKEVWCGVARLNEQSALPPVQPKAEAATPRPVHPLQSEPTGADKVRRAFSELPYPTQAALRCQEPIFWAFLREICAADAGDVRNEEQAKQAIYKICQVSSRADIKPDTEAAEYWKSLCGWFDIWQLKERVA